MTVSQDQFIQAVLSPDALRPEGLTDGQNRPAGRRFDVYRNNVAVSLTEALHEGFPVIAKLLGKENMDGLAGLYLRAHPPASPLMMHYGQAFPDFLAGMQQLSHLGYLADCARLDLALRRSYHAADAAPVDGAELAALPPEQLMAATVSLAPALAVISSDWPIYDIWCFNTLQDAPKPQAVAQDVLVTRPALDPQPDLLPAGAAAWIRGLAAGHSIGEAYDSALSLAPDFDLSATLALLLQGGGLTGLHSKG